MPPRPNRSSTALKTKLTAERVCRTRPQLELVTVDTTGRLNTSGRTPVSATPASSSRPATRPVGSITPITQGINCGRSTEVSTWVSSASTPDCEPPTEL